MTSSTRVLLLGATGQLGSELAPLLSTRGPLIRAARTADDGVLRVDLSDADSLRAAIQATNPSLIVNAAAYTAVDKAEQEPELAQLVNGQAVRVLAEEAAARGAALIHYSTDYVFDGSGTRPWNESDPTGPLNAYGRSKLAGETAIREVGPAHLIVRTSWVYGRRGQNFVKTMLRLGGQRRELSVVDDQVGAPTSAAFISEATCRILDLADGRPVDWLAEHGGTVHLAGGGETSWHGLALAIFELARRSGHDLLVEQVRPVPSGAYPTAAVRPRNSRLDQSRLAKQFGITPPDWREMLDDALPAILAQCTPASSAR